MATEEKVLEVVCGAHQTTVLSSQDAGPLVNGTGAELDERKILIGPGAMLLSPAAPVAADERGAFLLRAGMATAAKGAVALAANAPLYPDFANDHLSPAPALIAPTPGPWNFAVTGKTLLIAVDGAAAETVTVETGDVVDLAAVTAAELAALVNTDTTGLTASVVPGLDGASYLVLTKDTVGGYLELTGGTGLAVIGGAPGMRSTPCARTVQAASAGAERVHVIFDGMGLTGGGAAAGTTGYLDGLDLETETGAGDAGAIPMLFHASLSTNGETTIATPSRKARIIDWWLIARDTTASDVKLVNGATDASAAVAKGTADEALVRGGTLVAAQAEIAAGTALKAHQSAVAAVEVYVLALPVA